MSLTAFQRYRRLRQVEEMKPENIQKQAEKIEEMKFIEQPVMKESIMEEVVSNSEPIEDEVNETSRTSARRKRR